MVTYKLWQYSGGAKSRTSEQHYRVAVWTKAHHKTITAPLKNFFWTTFSWLSITTTSSSWIQLRSRRQKGDFFLPTRKQSCNQTTTTANSYTKIIRFVREWNAAVYLVHRADLPKTSEQTRPAKREKNRNDDVINNKYNKCFILALSDHRSRVGGASVEVRRLVTVQGSRGRPISVGYSVAVDSLLVEIKEAKSTVLLYFMGCFSCFRLVYGLFCTFPCSDGTYIQLFDFLRSLWPLSPPFIGSLHRRKVGGRLLRIRGGRIYITLRIIFM